MRYIRYKLYQLIEDFMKTVTKQYVKHFISHLSYDKFSTKQAQKGQAHRT